MKKPFFRVTTPMRKRDWTVTEWISIGERQAREDVELARWLDDTLPDVAIRIEIVYLEKREYDGRMA